MIELDAETGAVRLDPSDFEALLDAHRGGSPDERFAGLLDVIADSAGEMRFVVAGPENRLEHHGWFGDDALVLLLGVRPGVLQLIAARPGFLPATLVRLTRMRPRHLPPRAPVDFPATRLDDLVSPDAGLRATALAEVGADFAWRLDLTDGGQRVVTAVDGGRGPHLADPDGQRLVPVTNTQVYRILASTPQPG